MDLLLKYFPLSVGVSTVAKLVIGIILYVVVGAIGGAILGFLGAIPILGIAFTILGALLLLYTVLGIVLSVLSFKNVIL